MVRRRALHRLRNRIFIGTEGKSEGALVTWLQLICDELEIRLHLVHDPAGGGDTLAVVKESVVNRDKSRRKGRHIAELVILDEDRFAADADRGNRARDRAQQERLELIFLRANFEGLLLRLHSVHQTRQPPANETEHELRKVWPSYQKPPIAKDLHNRFSLDDLRRAAKFDQDLARLLEIVRLS